MTEFTAQVRTFFELPSNISIVVRYIPSVRVDQKPSYIVIMVRNSFLALKLEKDEHHAENERCNGAAPQVIQYID